MSVKKSSKPSKSKPAKSASKSTALTIPFSGNLDQPRKMPDLLAALDQVDKHIKTAIAQRNPQMGFTLIDGLGKLQQLGGIGSAKALWMMRANWGTLGKGRGEFLNEAYTSIGLAPDTATRYLKVWDMYEDLPKEVPPETRRSLMERPMLDQMAISSLYREGLLTPKKIKEISQAPDSDELKKQVRKLRNQPEPEAGAELVLEKDGALVAWQNGKKEPIGFLRVSPEDLKNKLVLSATERIIRRAGVRRASFAEDQDAEEES